MVEFIFSRRKALNLIKQKKFWFNLSFFCLILILFLINTFHEIYPDEFDNVLGGWFIIHGKLPYKDWFTHHGADSYFVSSVINLFSFHSFVKFRIVYAVFLLILTFSSFIFIKRRLPDLNLSFYYYFILFLAVSTTYFWGHMLLADNLAAFFLLPVFALIFLKAVNNKIFQTTDYIFISAFSGLAIFSALTYSFLVLGIYVFLFIYYFFLNRRLEIIELSKIAGILIAPYLLFLVYLLVTVSISDYYYQAIKFNRDFYIYYPGLEGKPPSNPLRYAIVIAQGFHNNYSSMLNTVKSFNFDFPFNIALAVSNASLGIYLILKKKYLVFLFVLGALIYANARTNPFLSVESDYQSAVYIMFSIFIGAFIIQTLYKELNSNIDYAKKLILSAVFLILLVYSFFNFTFVLRKFSYKAYDKYMGFASLIYDRPKIANYINQLADKNEYAWIGPFYFQDLYYMNAKVPTKYHVFLPGMGKSPNLTSELISDLNKNKPDVIYFNQDYYILGASPKEYGQDFINFLNQNYINLLGYDEVLRYKVSVDPSLDFHKKLFMRKEKAGEIVKKMEKLGWIQ